MQNKITQAFILCAGLGTRLRPLTDEVPKVMLPIASHMPLLEHTIIWFREQGIRRFVLNLHSFPEKITSYFGNGEKFGVEIVYSDETDKLMETGGAIKKAEHLLDDRFFLFYGDHLQFFDFSSLAQFHSPARPLATIVLKRSEFPRDADLAEVDPATKRIIHWYVRPHGIEDYRDNVFASTGIYALSKKVIDYIPEGVSIKLDGQITPSLLGRGIPLYGFATEEKILDIGNLEKYELAKKYYVEKMKSGRK
jgi:NDP-sugar pyrophosphorylase family protein